MYSNERERFPEELFLPVFPARDNLMPGTKDSSIPLTTPVPGLTAASSFLNQIPILPPVPSYYHQPSVIRPEYNSVGTYAVTIIPSSRYSSERSWPYLRMV